MARNLHVPMAQALYPARLQRVPGASMCWFVLLGFGSRWLAPWLARPMAWRILDGVISVTMLVLAALLLRHVF